MTHVKRVASHNYFKRQKKFNNIKLVNNWIKYTVSWIRSLKTTWNKLIGCNSNLDGDVPLLHTPNFFSSVLDDLQK